MMTEKEKVHMVLNYHMGTLEVQINNGQWYRASQTSKQLAVMLKSIHDEERQEKVQKDAIAEEAVARTEEAQPQSQSVQSSPRRDKIVK